MVYCEIPNIKSFLYGFMPQRDIVISSFISAVSLDGEDVFFETQVQRESEVSAARLVVSSDRSVHCVC